MIPRRLAALLLLTLIGCENTYIRFENLAPGSQITGLRWEPNDSDSIYETFEVLDPGQVSDRLFVSESDKGKEGRVSLQLVVDGNRVALVADDLLKARKENTTTFSITPESGVSNPLLEVPGG